MSGQESEVQVLKRALAEAAADVVRLSEKLAEASAVYQHVGWLHTKTALGDSYYDPFANRETFTRYAVKSPFGVPDRDFHAASFEVRSVRVFALVESKLAKAATPNPFHAQEP